MQIDDVRFHAKRFARAMELPFDERYFEFVAQLRRNDSVPSYSHLMTLRTSRTRSVGLASSWNSCQRGRACERARSRTRTAV